MEKKIFFTFFSFSRQNSISTEAIDAFLVSYRAEWSGADMCIVLFSKFWFVTKLWKNFDFLGHFNNGIVFVSQNFVTIEFIHAFLVSYCAEWSGSDVHAVWMSQFHFLWKIMQNIWQSWVKTLFFICKWWKVLIVPCSCSSGELVSLRYLFYLRKWFRIFCKSLR